MILKEYLDSRNISNKEFAKMLKKFDPNVKISESAIRNYREGIRTPPLEIALLIRRACGNKVSLDELKKK